MIKKKIYSFFINIGIKILAFFHRRWIVQKIIIYYIKKNRKKQLEEIDEYKN
jgi:hypothetical protein